MSRYKIREYTGQVTIAGVVQKRRLFEVANCSGWIIETGLLTRRAAEYVIEERRAEDAIDERDPFDDGDRAFDMNR
jgi:hypothetical protein